MGSIVVKSVFPHLDLIGRTRGEDELAVGVEAQAVDLGSVSIDRVAGFGRGVGPGVPSGGGWRRGHRLISLELKQ